MLFQRLFIIGLSILFSSPYSLHASENKNCKETSLTFYDEEFKCNNLNNYFVNSFHSHHVDKFKIDDNKKYGYLLLKPSVISQFQEWTGIYPKRVDGKTILLFGFPDQRMARDSTSLWKTYLDEFDKLPRDPYTTSNLNNGFNSSISAESN